MNRHSFWCSIDKEKVCDCGYAELLEARHLLLEMYNDYRPTSNGYGDLECPYCFNESFKHTTNYPNIEHQENCTYLRLHIYLEKNNAL